MKLDKGNHKLFLWYLFHPESPQGRQERKFPLDKLTDASSALKKLTQGSVVKDGSTTFSSKAVDFNISESKLLQDLVNEITEATVSEQEIIEELKEALK